jgi:hypothetical protein
MNATPARPIDTRDPRTPTVTVDALEFFADNLDVAAAAAAYREYGAIVIRGLMRPYLGALQRDIAAAFAQGVSLLPEAKHVPGIGWNTPDGALWLPAPAGFARDKQMMIPAVRYDTSGAFFTSAFHAPLLDVVSEILGPDIELFLDGQCLYKEPVGGHPKNLHQDSAYFEHRYDGPVAALNYAVNTDLVNGTLYVVPGSHRLGQLRHIDTFSHLGLDPDEWPWEAALPITGQAGDSILFNYRCIHGSQENHSTAPRPVFIHRYRRPDDYTVVSAATVEARAAAEKTAAAASKQNQRGMMVRGFRRYEASEPPEA